MLVQISLWFSIRSSLLFSTFLLVASMSLSLSVFSDPIKESSTGDMYFSMMDENNSPMNPIHGLHIKSHVDIHISGMIAKVELQQTFKNPSDNWVEGRYVFPLPEKAAVNALTMTVGERLLKGEVKEKSEAKKIYQQAKSSGKKAALLVQHRPNLFSQNITNIGPQDTIVVHLSYLQDLSYQNDAFSLRLPMTLTPRYIPGAQIHEKLSLTDTDIQPNQPPKNISIDDQGWGWSPSSPVVPDAHLITPPLQASQENKVINPISMHIQLDAGLPLASIKSAYHDITIEKKNSIHHIHFSNNEVSMDKDFLLTWKPTIDHSPQAAIFSETIDGDDYSMIMLMPPRHDANKKQSITRETIFIIDTSGSMAGTSIRQAKDGLLHALQYLSPQDKFNIIEFNSSYSTLFTRSDFANNENIQTAESFVKSLKANGGTVMLPALQEALLAADNSLLSPENSSYLRQIVFITDGSVGNESQIFDHIYKNLHNSRLFTIGIGSAPNLFFMRKAAQFGRGSFTSIGNIDEVEQKISSLFKKISSPVLYNIQVTGTNNSTNGENNLELTPDPIPDLYLDEPIQFYLRKDYELDILKITGQHQSTSWEQKLVFNHSKKHPGVSALWARNKIESLLDSQVTGASEETIKPNVLALALQHQLMSPYTSFIVTDTNISRNNESALKKAIAANATPHGQQWQSLSYPQTATPLWLNVILGFLSCMLLSLLRLRKTR
jgi:Ca-activated chloride channel family protein